MSTQIERFKYNAGASGTVTVPHGRCITGVTAHATGSGATLTIAAQGESTDADSTGDAIPIPAGTSISFGVPVIEENIDQLGPGTVLTFTGTDSYFIVYRQVKA